MLRILSLLVFLLLFPGSVWCQSASTDSQTLQALLSEVRQLRKDLQTTTVATQRAQILLYRLQAQEANVTRATRRADEAKTRLAASQSEHKMLASEQKRTEEMLNDSARPEVEHKQAEETISRIKTRLEQVEGEEQQRQTTEIEASNELQNERIKLIDLQEQLDRLQKTLETISQQGSGGSR